MTRGDFIFKWALYAAGLFPVLVVNLYLLPWFPIFGTIPTLLPVAAVAVAVLEGPKAGAGFGLLVGILSDALIPGIAGSMTLGLSLLGAGAGAAARYVVRQNLLGCLLCSAGTLVVIDLFRCALFLLQRKAGLLALARVALPEILWSLILTPVVYAIFRWIYRRVPKAPVLL